MMDILVGMMKILWIGQIAFKKGFKDFFIKIEDSEFKNDTIRVSVHNCSK